MSKVTPPWKCRQVFVWTSVPVQAVREVTWSLPNDDLRLFVERNHGKELDGEYGCGHVA